MTLTRNVNGEDVELTPQEEVEWEAQQLLDAATAEKIQAELQAQEVKTAKLQEALELFAKERGIL